MSPEELAALVWALLDDHADHLVVGSEPDPNVVTVTEPADSGEFVLRITVERVS